MPGIARLLARLRGTPAGRCLEEARSCAARRGERLYLVGGCVRDLLLGSALRDLDLVVEGDARGLAACVATALGGRVHAASRFGTCRVEGPAGLRVDVAMARRERYAGPAALPSVSPAGIEEDLLRRDFTINSMAVRLDGPGGGALLDPYGGLRDLEGRRLRLHHPRSLVDDPTRALRAGRYAVRLRLRAAPPWREALDAAASRRAFDALSCPRLRRELAIAWREREPARVLAWWARWGILEVALPGLRWSRDLAASVRRAGRLRDAGLAGDESLLLAVLAGAVPAARRAAFARRVGLAGRAASRVLQAARLARRPVGSGAGPERLERLHERSPLAALAIEAAGEAGARRAARRWRAARSRYAPALRGGDLLAMGVPGGPAVGALLHALRAARIEGRVRTAAQERSLVRAALGDGTRRRPRPRRRP